LSQKALKRRRREARQRHVEPRRGRKRVFLFGLIGMVLLGSLVAAGIVMTRGVPTGGFAIVGQEFPIVGREHVPEGTTVTRYNSNPPSSGPHWPTPAAWGVYGSPLPDEQLVHNLEHGGIWISYKDVDEATRLALERLAGKYPQAVILTPRRQNDSKIAVVSWGRILKIDAFDEQRVVAFIAANVNKSPEPLASLEPPAVRVGELFPDFRVTEVDGRVLTRASLGGRPGIVWFTTSYCVPCQIGAAPVERLKAELGRDAFSVLVLFVDLRETNAHLIWWRKEFAGSDWMVAFDPDLALARRVQLRFLDTKFLLDERGIIRNIDYQTADERYLNVVRDAVRRRSAT